MNDKHRRSKQEAAFFSECIEEGVAAEHALDYFERACNHFGTLFAPTEWLQPRRDALKEVLPPVIGEDQAAGLRAAIYKTILLDSVIDWLKSGCVNRLTDVDRERRFQDDARRHISPIRFDPEKANLMFERVKQLAQKKREAEKEPIQSSMQMLEGVLCERLKSESVSLQPARAKALLEHILGG